MTITIQDVDTLQKYIEGVMERADHHAVQVAGVALALSGAIIWRKDDDEEIEVLERDGELKNVLWVWIGGSRYAFSFNHDTGQIEMREGSTQGAVIQSFDNNTTMAHVESVFRGL